MPRRTTHAKDARPRSQQAECWTYCIRRPNPTRRKRETHEEYKKGYEVRFSVASAAELRRLRRWLKGLGLRPGRPYDKANRKILPVYGKEAVDAIEGASR
ncbi:MAG: hypothetical protein ACF8R7_12570 [Phycisphaerales bacterium JB039]